MTIFNYFLTKPPCINLPKKFNAESMYRFISETITAARSTKIIVFNFSALEFIEPVGIVVLSNFIEFLKKKETKVDFDGYLINSEANNFLKDAGFFKLYVKGYTGVSNISRQTTKPLKLISSNDTTSYLYSDLVPWIEDIIKVQTDSLAALRTSIEEIFHNIRDHSGVNIGCVFAQHYPKKNEIQIAISDFGLGTRLDCSEEK